MKKERKINPIEMLSSYNKPEVKNKNIDTIPNSVISSENVKFIQLNNVGDKKDIIEVSNKVEKEENQLKV